MAIEPRIPVTSKNTCSQVWSAKKLNPNKGSAGKITGSNMQCNAHKDVAVIPILSNTMSLTLS